MKIDSSQRDIELIGDIKEFKTSIDPKNLEFITTLLSSNLYSNPEQSFIREIVSNAWDSHVEAGNTEEPVIIKFSNEQNSWSITIRDYGTGISPERFREIYCNIGSSTKRESNEFIGGFGIGKYSALACSNSVYITSYYNGVAYYYLMLKSGNCITTNLLSEVPTEERNGVEVTIKSILSISPFQKALEYIVFFPNIYVTGHYSGSMINDTKIKKFKNFSCASISINHKLLLGNVLYPCDISYFSKEAGQFLNWIRNSGVVINFKVGEVNITPNRENVIYTFDTIQIIESRILEAKKELESFIAETLNRNYNSISEYYKTFDWCTFDIISGVASSKYISSNVQISNTSPFINITYKSKELKKDHQDLKRVYNSCWPHRGVIGDTAIHQKKIPWNLKYFPKISSNKIILISPQTKLNYIIKAYLVENYTDYVIVPEISLAEFKDHLTSEVWDTKFLDSDIVTDIYNEQIGKGIKIDFNSDPSFLEFKSSFLEDRKNNNSGSLLSVYPIYVYHSSEYTETKKYYNISDLLSYMKALKKGIILGNMDDDSKVFTTIAKLKKMQYITASKKVIAEIKKHNPSYLVDKEWLLNKDPMLSIVKTVRDFLDEDLDVLMLKAIPEEFSKEFTRILRIREYYIRDAYYNRLSENASYDDYTMYLCKKMNTYSRACKSIYRKFDALDSPAYIKEALIIKTKAFRVNYNTYKHYKDNKILRVLCRK